MVKCAKCGNKAAVELGWKWRNMEGVLRLCREHASSWAQRNYGTVTKREAIK
jgi:hypothetical protein